VGQRAGCPGRRLVELSMHAQGFGSCSQEVLRYRVNTSITSLKGLIIAGKKCYKRTVVSSLESFTRSCLAQYG
jgi:hypothetical protein